MAVLLFSVTLEAQAAPSPLQTYARHLAARQGWVGAQWQALDWIVTRESGWNPCRHYPSTTDCAYTGRNSCGVPQKQPCPDAWRGRLWASRWEQVRELIRYVKGRYGDPLHAKGHWLAYRWY